MSDCTEPKYREMIHAFELGLLIKDDRLEFEEHLLVCESCFKEVEDFLPASVRIRHKKEFIANEQSAEKPDGNKFRFNFRLLALAAVIILVAIPGYLFLIHPSESEGIIQRLELLPVRGGESPVLDIEQGGEAEIRFLMESWQKETSYNVTITSRSGAVIFADKEFTDFDTSGFGHIELPISVFKPGFYFLSVREKNEDAQNPVQQYNFTVR